MTTLARWIDDQVAAGARRDDIARRIGISRNYLAEIASGTKQPSLTVAFQIETESGGAVPANSLIKREGAA